VEAEEWDCGEQRDQDEAEVVAVVKWKLRKERFTRSSAACTCSALGCALHCLFKWRGVYITSASEETKGAGPSAGPTRHSGTPRRPRRCRMQTCRGRGGPQSCCFASGWIGPTKETNWTVGPIYAMFACLIIRTFQLVVLTGTMFFSHYRLANNTFCHSFSAKRTGS
jgi:hypothetical protein